MAQRVKLTLAQDSGYIAVTGSLPGVASLYHNEESVPGLDDGRFTTARSIIGQNGYFCTHMRMMSSPTSDFRYVQYREVMDLACRVTRTAFMQFLNADLVIDSDGHIDESEATRIESYTKGMLAANLAGLVSDIQGVTIDRTVNILSTQSLLGTVRLRPKGYAKFIEISVGYVNPALTIGA
jgi:hypothetical protein